MKGSKLLNKRTVALVAAAGVAFAGLAINPKAAEAFDPISNSYAIVGSDTLEDVVGAIANGTKAAGGSVVRTVTTDSKYVGSFDATGSAGIITKSGKDMFQRPNGSGDGRKSLGKAIANQPWTSSYVSTTLGVKSLDNQSVFGSIDISRGSDGGTVNADTNLNILKRFTFGRDAISYVYSSTVGDTSLDQASPYQANKVVSAANITLADLKKIYECDAATLAKYNITKPMIPQSGSGTRKDFGKKLNSSTTTELTYGACVGTNQEHDASKLGTSPIATNGDFMPMSVSRWIAMNNGLSTMKVAAGVVLGSAVSGKTATTGTPAVIETGANAGRITTKGSLVPSIDYYKDDIWGRNTYLFVEKARVEAGAKYDPSLASLFSRLDSEITALTHQGSAPLDASYTSIPNYDNSTVMAVKLKYGFLPATTFDTEYVDAIS